MKTAFGPQTHVQPLPAAAVMAAVLATVLATAPVESAAAATYSELSAMQGGPQPYYPPNPYAAGPYAAPPGVGACPQCGPQPFSGGPQGVPPAALDAPGAASLPSPRISTKPYLPLGPEADLPHGRLQVWSFGQVNSTTDPFNSTGLSTPFMFVPWSTPLSGWTNAQTWNWWRERAGVQPPYW
jgi:hypothetical protein